MTGFRREIASHLAGELLVLSPLSRREAPEVLERAAVR